MRLVSFYSQSSEFLRKLDIKIKSAVFGTANNSHSADCTDMLRMSLALCDTAWADKDRRGPPKINVQIIPPKAKFPNVLQVDPAPGQLKDLKITWTYTNGPAGARSEKTQVWAEQSSQAGVALACEYEAGWFDRGGSFGRPRAGGARGEVSTCMRWNIRSFPSFFLTCSCAPAPL